MTATKRISRPQLERERPVRAWSTLFGPPEPGRTSTPNPTPATKSDDGRNGAPASPSSPDAPPGGGPLADAVERGYRVIDEYMRQGQTFAQAFDPSPWMSSAQPGSPPDMQQLAQRVMQYGWDFAGLWFELWTRTAGGMSPPTGPAPFGIDGASFMRATPEHKDQPATASAPVVHKPLRIAVSVESERTTATTLELSPGAAGPLAIHALRAEGQDVPPIRSVHVEAPGSDDTVRVKVIVSADTRPGVYNAMIIDTESNLPRGTLSLQVLDEKKR